VILATGAESITPQIPGVELPHVVQAWDVLQNKVHTGKRVVVIGGGAVGVETAMFLAEKGTLSGDAIKFLLVNKAENPELLYELATKGTKEIVLIEMLEKIGQDIGKSTKWCMFQEMSRGRIDRKISTKALEITSSYIKVEANDKIEEIPADTIVLAVGSRSSNPLSEILEKKGIPFKVAGDANKVAQAIDAVHRDLLRAGRYSKGVAIH
jgi:2,4-dienoyl-CoA reductase (NADPH2)